MTQNRWNPTQHSGHPAVFNRHLLAFAIPTDLIMPPLPPAKKLRIAIVDDHAPFRNATCRVLDGAGFSTRGFASAADFIRSGSLVGTDCLVLDVTMPDIDGFSLQECLRATNYELPIIFCSGVENDRAIARARANGAASFLRKPVTAQQLIKAVRTACKLDVENPPHDLPTQVGRKLPAETRRKG